MSLADHTPAVVAVASGIADAYAEGYAEAVRLNRDHVVAGALLHDVGKFLV